MYLASYTLQTMACWSESSRGRKINLLLWESSDSSCEEVHEWDTSKRRIGRFRGLLCIARVGFVEIDKSCEERV
jgi:hypothetical protein